jgi:hypothetical protein
MIDGAAEHSAFSLADSASLANAVLAWFAAISLRVDTVHLLVAEPAHCRGLNWDSGLLRQNNVAPTPA